MGASDRKTDHSDPEQNQMNARGSRLQTIFNIISLIMLVVLSALVLYCFLRLGQIDDSSRATHHLQELTENESSETVTSAVVTQRRIKRNLSTGQNQDVEDLHHNHWRSKYEELERKVTQLQQQQAWRPAYAHMKLCSGTMTCHRNFSNYARWTDDSNCDNRTSSMPSLHHEHNATASALAHNITFHQNLSSPIVPQDGLYMIYSQITWIGKKNLTMALRQTSNNKSPGFSIVTIPSENCMEKEKELVTSRITQYKLGDNLNISGRTTEYFPDDFAMDSHYASGVFRLKAGQILGVKLLLAGTHIIDSSDHSYFGFYQISS